MKNFTVLILLTLLLPCPSLAQPPAPEGTATIPLSHYLDLRECSTTTPPVDPPPIEHPFTVQLTSKGAETRTAAVPPIDSFSLRLVFNPGPNPPAPSTSRTEYTLYYLEQDSRTPDVPLLINLVANDGTWKVILATRDGQPWSGEPLAKLTVNLSPTLDAFTLDVKKGGRGLIATLDNDVRLGELEIPAGGMRGDLTVGSKRAKTTEQFWPRAVIRTTTEGRLSSEALTPFDPDKALEDLLRPQQLVKSVSGETVKSVSGETGQGVAPWVNRFNWPRFINRGPYYPLPPIGPYSRQLSPDQQAQEVEQRLRQKGGGSAWYLKAISRMQDPETFTEKEVDEFLNGVGIVRGAPLAWGEEYTWPSLDVTRNSQRMRLREYVEKVAGGSPNWEALAGHRKLGAIIEDLAYRGNVSWFDVIQKLAALSDANDSAVRGHMSFWARLAQSP